MLGDEPVPAPTTIGSSFGAVGVCGGGGGGGGVGPLPPLPSAFILQPELMRRAANKAKIASLLVILIARMGRLESAGADAGWYMDFVIIVLLDFCGLTAPHSSVACSNWKNVTCFLENLEFCRVRQFDSLPTTRKAD
jgi:hypothetical protein